MKLITMKSLVTLLATGMFTTWAWDARIDRCPDTAIVSYRSENGEFKHVDELVNVKGIGIRTVDINREYILLDNSKLAASK